MSAMALIMMLVGTLAIVEDPVISVIFFALFYMGRKK